MKAWIHKNHLTKKGRDEYIKAQTIFYGTSYEKGKIEIVFEKPANPDFVAINITPI
jgi:hypothetical protein